MLATNESRNEVCPKASVPVLTKDTSLIHINFLLVLGLALLLARRCVASSASMAPASRTRGR